MKQKNTRFLKLLILVSIPLLFSTCKKTELSGVANSSLNVFEIHGGYGNPILVSCPDGGFVAGSLIWVEGTEFDIVVRKYSKQFDLEWERTMGGNGFEQLDQIFVDENKNILVAGFTHGFSQDALSRQEVKKTVPYFKLFSADGQTIWEKDYPSLGGGSAVHKQQIKDIIKDDNGDFMICCNLSLTESSWLFGFIIRLSPQGVLKGYFEMGSRATNSAIFNAVTENIVFLTSYDENPPLAGFMKIFKSNPGGIDKYHDIHLTSWPWPQGLKGYDNGSIAQLKNIPDNGPFTYNYFFANKIYQYTLDYLAHHVNGQWVNTDFKNIISVHSSFDNHYLLTQEDGKIFEINSDFSTINMFQTQLIVFKRNSHEGNVVCKLTSGDYVLGYAKDKVFYITHFNSQGQIINHE